MTDVARVAAGHYHSLVLKTDGTLWTFGANYAGQLGTSVDAGSWGANPTPMQVITDVTDIAAGFDQSLVVRNDGTVGATLPRIALDFPSPRVPTTRTS